MVLHEDTFVHTLSWVTFGAWDWNWYVRLHNGDNGVHTRLEVGVHDVDSYLSAAHLGMQLVHTRSVMIVGSDVLYLNE